MKKAAGLAHFACIISAFVGPRALGEDSTVSGERAAHPNYLADTIVVGARAGFYNVEALNDLVLGYGAFGDYAVATNFLVGATLDYWSRSSTSILESSSQVSDLALGANGKFVFTRLNVPFRPYAMAGVAAHRIVVDARGDAVGNSSSDVNRGANGKFSIDLGGGLMYRIQKSMDVDGEVRWRKLTDTGANLDQIAFTGGLSYAI